MDVETNMTKPEEFGTQTFTEITEIPELEIYEPKTETEQAGLPLLFLTTLSIGFFIAVCVCVVVIAVFKRKSKAKVLSS